MSVAEPVAMKKRGHLEIAKIVLATALVTSPAWVGGYLDDRFVNRGRLSISVVALLCLAMFVVGAFLMVRLLKE
jgi:hypothetical protein